MLESKFYHFCLVTIIVALLTGCRGGSETEIPPDSLVIGIESNPSHLDPRYATDANSSRISLLIYNSLLRIDQNSRLVGDLAEHWTMLDDLTYIFRIRRGVTFHDGSPLTSSRRQIHL